MRIKQGKSCRGRGGGRVMKRRDMYIGWWANAKLAVSSPPFCLDGP